MTEYMEKHEVAKLIGAPPGYVGYEEGGQLTEAVRTKPYSVVLLDEIEKAHPDVFNILIQILEDGRLTDNKGRTVSFKNTIIIATSNLGTALIQGEDLKNFNDQAIFASQQGQTSKSLEAKQQLQSAPLSSYTMSVANGHSQVTGGATSESAPRKKPITERLMEELQKFFKPEVLNRFDEIIIFKPLLEEHMMKIATIGINNTKKLLIEQKLDLEISAAALSKLAVLGYDPIFGARPLRRTIQTRIENPISTLLIQKAFVEGDTILIDFDTTANNFTFIKKAKPATTEQTPNPMQQANQPTQPSMQNGYTLPENGISQQPAPSMMPPQNQTPIAQQPTPTPVNPFSDLAGQTQGTTNS